MGLTLPLETTLSMTNKVQFADMLRGIAALSVLIAHYCGTFFEHHAGIASLILVPPLEDLPPVTGLAKLIGDYSIVLGQFGVGVFFIISGFVIPFSMASSSKLDFLHRRAFRIFPVYIAGFSIVIGSIWLLTAYRDTDFSYSAGHIVSHFGIITRGILGYGRIDGISWTLEVELMFYLVMTVMGARVLSRGARPLVIGAIAVAGLSILSSQLLKAGHYNLVGATGFQLWASLLLIIGLAYHGHFTGKISREALILVHALVAILIATVWMLSDRNVYQWQWIAGYYVAMMVFAAGYTFRDKVRPNRPLAHLSSISYPLYVVHALAGYAVMYWAVDNGAGAYAAILAATVTCYLISVLLHYTVEKPLIRNARRSQQPKGAAVESVP